MKQKIHGFRPLFLIGIITVVFVFAFTFSFVYLATSHPAFYAFSLVMPEEVTANPGETVTVDGEIYVTGIWWLHRFNLTIENLQYDYEVIPDYWQDVRVIREWNPTEGLYKAPEKFQIKIHVPEDAYGVQIPIITGQEHHSFKQVSNSTYFVLKVSGEVKPPVEHALTVSDIAVPELIEEGVPFDITFTVNNEGDEATTATISITMPEGWEVDRETQLVAIEAKGSAVGKFVLTPSEAAGGVSLFIEYPYRETILNLTRVGPTLTPTVPETTTTLVEKTPFEKLIDDIREAITPYAEPVTGPMAGFLTPIMIGIVILLLVIIVWLLAGIVGHYMSKPKKKKKKTTKQLEAESELDFSDKLDFFETGVDKL